ncbi:MAG TPA: sigma 54-interacting transcriptional regulator [Pyrinomonadaceae bacterium]|nr:sigma 54-interacting transcriptional regulator [Pyrinomonadaceae bacterium]
MNPRLIAISGSLKGTIFSLAQEEISIGRDLSNSVSLNDASVSRRHCLIKKNGSTDGFHVTDLESYNGTFVNGVQVAEQALTHGDQIALGDLRFIFLTHDDAVTTAARLEDDDLITRSTIQLEREQAFYLRPEGAVPEISVDSRAIRERNALLKISTTINSIRNWKELQLRLLELTLDVVPAERGAILMADEDGEHFVSCHGWNRVSGADESIKVSQTISTKVLRDVVAILSNEVVQSESSGLPSLVEAQVSSLLCVPLVAFEKPLGVIYLDTSSRVAKFDEVHLQLLTAIAGIAAIAFENARRFEQLEKENRRLQEAVKLEHQMVGESQSMREVYALLSKVAASASTVLLLGESGTGKELAARAIHLNSPRASKAFVAINCATLTESLLESELFGHEKGSFTGAVSQKRGKLELADGGTVFLDEVGELSPAIQAKLLRALQTREFERVGGTRPINVDVRMIAATNRDLKAAIKAGQFREDLYYRLNVVSIPMPPLRERREDIPLLAAFFVAEYSKKCKRRVTGVSAEARRLLCSYDWPGNVRQLENAIERAVVLGATELITPEDLPEIVEREAIVDAPAAGYFETIREAKRQLVTKTLRQTGGNFTEAAKLLGMHPNNLHRLVTNLNLRETS